VRSRNIMKIGKGNSRETRFSGSLSNTDLVWPDLGSNPVRRRRRLATGCLKYGRTVCQEGSCLWLEVTSVTSHIFFYFRPVLNDKKKESYRKAMRTRCAPSNSFSNSVCYFYVYYRKESYHLFFWIFNLKYHSMAGVGAGVNRCDEILLTYFYLFVVYFFCAEVEVGGKLRECWSHCVCCVFLLCESRTQEKVTRILITCVCCVTSCQISSTIFGFMPEWHF
jgi:hypothetical protein